MTKAPKTDPLNAHQAALRKELKRLKGSDAERQRKAVHRIRVLTRRLEILIGLFPEESRKRTPQRLRRSLKTLRRLLGKVREKDVHQALWKEHGRGQICFRTVEREIERRRSKAFDRFQKKWKGRRFQDVLKKFGKVWDGIERPPAPQKIVADWTAKILKVSQDAKGLEPIHRIRLKVKKLRYLLENLEAANLWNGGNGNTAQPVALLKDLQKELGRIHDLETLGEFLKKAVRRYEDLWDPRTRSTVEKVAEELKQKLEAAVSEWHRQWPKRRMMLAPAKKRRTNSKRAKKVAR